MMKNELKIGIDDEEVRLSLWKDKVKFDEICIVGSKKVSTEFLPQLDKLLKKNNINLKSIEKINFDSNISSNFTSHRIIQTIKNILSWSKEF